MKILMFFLCVFTFTITQSQNTMSKNIYDYSFTSLEGEEISLADFKGKKMLLVNTASKCGFTPQYKELESLYQQYKDRLIIIGFPANNFRNQEPGTNEDIAAFCERNYGVTFPMSEKTTVVGENQDPIYRWLTSKAYNGKKDSTVKWNFQKYLIDENGNLIDVFESAVTPLSDAIVKHLKS